MGFTKVLVVLIVVAVCVDLWTDPVEAAGRNKTRKGGGRRRQGRRRPRQPRWLKEAVGKRSVDLKISFNSVKFQNGKMIDVLKPSISLMKDISDFRLVKQCNPLFSRPVNYTEKDSAKGQTDVILRMKAFQTLLQTTKNNCQELEDHVKELLQDATEAVQNYISKLTATCERHSSSRSPVSRQKCGEVSNNEYSCETQVCNKDNADTSREQALILSRQLECFLVRLRSSKPIQCTGQGPLKTRRRKRKTKDNKSKRKTKKGKQKKNRKNRKRAGKTLKTRQNRHKKSGDRKNRKKKNSRQSAVTGIPATE